MLLQKWEVILIHEHDLLLKSLTLLDRELGRLEEKHAEPVKLIHLLNFLLEFGDNIHNVKEENHLFPIMVERGIPQTPMIKKMLLDHEVERELIAGILPKIEQLANEPSSQLKILVERLHKYIANRKEHIGKENQNIYPQAREVITEEDQEKIQFAFSKIDEKNGHENVIQYYSRILQNIG